MRIMDGSSDVCSSDLRGRLAPLRSETAAGTSTDALGSRHVPRKSYVEDSAHRRGQRAQYEAVQRPSGSPWLPDVEDARRHPGPVDRAGTTTRPHPHGHPTPGSFGAGGDQMAERGRQSPADRSEEHTSELQSLMRISNAV